MRAGTLPALRTLCKLISSRARSMIDLIGHSDQIVLFDRILRTLMSDRKVTCQYVNVLLTCR